MNELFIFSVIMPILIFLIVILIKICCGIFVGKTAKNKGYSFWGFFLLGFFSFIIGFIVILCLKEKNSHNDCQTIFHNSKISPTEELASLKKLLDDNAISQEEFDAKKKQLLGL